MSDGVAIVGMAGRFPGARSIEEFWANLIAGRESITRFTPQQLSPLVPEDQRRNPGYVAARGTIADAERFDAAFFDIPPREADVMDPQQRVFLELCWNALEHAGIDTRRYPGSIGVYAGVSNNAYRKLVEARPELVNAIGEFATMLANEKDYVATRVAHRIGLNGPAISVHTACSTSLVAIAQAWYALMSWQCDAALAGGINIAVPQESGYVPVDGGMESSDGHCRPFDAQASGTLFSSGGGVIVMKRLADALADGDTIWAVLRGVGLNNDGADKASFTAPSVRGQAGAIRMALANANVAADSIGYVEAHGTGTQLGDPIEVEALTRAFREDTEGKQFCWLGSVKSNFGHLVAGSGVTGVIKAVLALHHEKIPATLHHARANPEIDFASSPFKVADRIVPWPRGEQPRRAGVSSFGVGGTNAHVILEEAPLAAPCAPGRTPVVLPLSARDEAALQRRAQELAAALEYRVDAELPDIVWTLASGRRELPVRAAIVADSIAAARERLRDIKSAAALERPRVVFLFPGQGSQHANMARGLVDAEPVFAQHFARCCESASRLLGRDLRALILPPSDEAAVQTLLEETRFAQPGLFAVEYALAKLWQSWGVQPDAMIGHSIGEYVAACLAGVFTLDDAMRLVVARGAAMHAQPRGAMLAVRAGEADVAQRLPGGIEIAGVNAAQVTVVAGASAAIDAFAAQLAQAQIASSRLHVSHAFHSATMDGALPEFRRAFDGVRLNAPTLPFYSCVSGRLIAADEATSPEYWCRQIRATVRFADAAHDALRDARTIALEVGPRQALSGLLRRTPEWNSRVVASLGAADARDDDAAQLANAVGKVWCLGGAVDWTNYCGNARCRVPLPGYPFAGPRHWVDPPAKAGARDDPIAISAAPAAPTNAVDRMQRLRTELRELFESLSGEHLDATHDAQSLLELGLDSLALTQAALELDRRYGLKIKFRRLMEDLNSVEKLAALLDQTLPAEVLAAPVAASAVSAVPTDVAQLAQLIQNQMAMLQQQAQMLASLAGQSMPATASTLVAAAASDATPADLRERPFGAAARITVKRDHEFTRQQRAWIDAFTQRYNARTAKSKAFSQRHRALMADPRVVTGFNPLWKELVYPIVAERSQGAHLWDIDGNQYIDLLNGFGANFLGYQPPFVKDALVAQIEAGFEIGPQHPLTAEVSELISGMTGMPRVAFCNTGSEAVMGAMRIARTVTGRKTIAIFRDSYHGIFDEVIVRGTHTLRSIAAAPGILASAVENVMVLDYGSDEALRILRERAHELAAVMIEPVQGKHPDVQPRAFVQALRGICDQGGCALIFDEVITGFRIASGGAQEFYGVRADIATYGKIIGGGLPFAAIAGRERWMDALDGGQWQYGDDSFPEAGVTYFAGTFVRHPLALAAAKAALLHLKERGPALQRELNARTAALVDRLNRFFDAHDAPLHALGFASLWKVLVDADQPYAELFYYALRERGLHLYAQFNCFLTDAHDQAIATTIAERIEDATRELLAAGVLSRRGAAVVAAAPSMSAIDTGSAQVATTDAQIEKWLACQFGDAANAAFNESLLLTLDGNMDRAALERAVAFVTARHEAFAMSFAADGASLRVGGLAPLPLPCADLRTGGEAALREHCATSVRRPFALGEAPLARFELIALGERRHVLFIVAHHLIFDGWSAAVLMEELASAYKAFAGGAMPQLAPAESFRAYASSERERRSHAEAQAQLQHWLDAYATLPPALELPADRTRAAATDFSADTVFHEFSERWTSDVRQLARRCGVTVYSVLLAGFSALVTRMSGQNDLAFGIPFAGQALAGNAHLIGDGVNTLPLRVATAADETFATLARRCHALLVDAAENQDLTLHTLLRALAGKPRGHALTSLIFNLNPRVPALDFGGLDYRLRDFPKCALLWELFLNFNDVGHTFTLDLHFRTALFDAQTIRTWIGHLETLLSAAAAQSDTVVSALPLLHAGQQQALADDWDTATRRYDRTQSLPDMIAAQAAQHPDRAAVECNGVALSYAELLHKSRAVARLLVARGVERGEPIGICMPRGNEMLVAMLGTLFAGAAYLPLDPAYPAERLRYMAGHAHVRHVLVSNTQVPDAVAAGRTLHVLDETAAQESAAGDLPRVSGDDLAYVLYTSGSTGAPKGVRVLHRNVVNFLHGMRERPGLSADDAVLAATTLSFDIAGLELYLPLVCGARVVIADDTQHRDPGALLLLMRERRVSVAQCTPTLLRILLAEDRNAVLQRVKLLVGGEELPRDLAAAALPACRELWNMYGPTETTIWSAAHRVDAVQGAVPIGTAIANTRLYVLDDARQLVPDGVSGEIWIAGDGVADGYLHQPQLSAERFVDDPFRAGDRMYRSGDLGAWRQGLLYYRGRNDDQFKLRGFRIEPGEIEAAALKFPGVRAAAASVFAVNAEDRRLVLYVETNRSVRGAPSTGAQTDADFLAKLREHLRQSLPPQLLPQLIETLPALPQTANGKIDRKALPAPAALHAAPAPPLAHVHGQHLHDHYTQDQQIQDQQIRDQRIHDRIEQMLLEVWSDLLQVAPIGVDDNFFDLGGDSLLGVELFHRILARTGVNLPLATLLTAPSVAEQARAIAAVKPHAVETRERAPLAADHWSPLVTIQPLGTRPPLFCIHALGGNVLNYMPVAQALGADQPCFGLQAPGLDGLTSPLTSIEEMASRYHREIRAHTPNGPYYLCGGSMGGLIAFEIAQQLMAQGETVAFLGLFDTYGPGNSEFEIERHGALGHLRHRWRDRWERARKLDARGCWNMFGAALQRRLARVRDALLVRWYRRRGEALPHTLRYREIERVHLRANDTYVPLPYHGAITLFRAAEQPDQLAGGPTLGWYSVAKAGMRVIDLPGTHDTLIEQPELAPALREELALAQRQTAGVRALRAAK